MIEPLMDKISLDAIGLDYGCGFAPALPIILKNFGFKIKLYDPFFYS